MCVKKRHSCGGGGIFRRTGYARSARRADFVRGRGRRQDDWEMLSGSTFKAEVANGGEEGGVALRWDNAGGDGEVGVARKDDECGGGLLDAGEVLPREKRILAAIED